MIPAATPPVLSVQNLCIGFDTDRGPVSAVEDLSFDLAPGEVLGIVGESGSGKSVTALALMGLLPKPPARVSGGRVLLEGEDLLRLGESRMRRVRGARMAMIFQEPMTSLNPVFSVGDQIVETIRAHEPVGRRAAWQRAIELLARVGIPSPARYVNQFPHQLSGGQRQRVMIAIALACSPRVLLADEPTTALDVTIQAQILELLRALQRELGMAVVMITHNMGVIADLADRVLVMYAGRAVEQGSVHDVFERPAHPYTRALLDSVPQLEDERARLYAIPGSLPSPRALPPGCRFMPRCDQAIAACGAGQPPWVEARDGQRAACLRVRQPAGASAP
jgi:oligopeptide/dipeptide ABC transporter ATP-binding protein